MSFSSLFSWISFANPWGLLALLAIPAIILIHMYHRRFPPMVIAGLHLWSSHTLQPLPGRKREKLPITPSLILELLAAFLLAMILSGPRFGEADKVVHLIAILDDTAYMSARADKNTASPRDLAIFELEKRFEKLPRSSVVTLLLTGARSESLGHAIPWSEAKERLAGWQPSAPRHAFGPAWDMGLQLANRSGQLLFLTARLVRDSNRLYPDSMEVVSLGEPLENVSISAARWTFDSAKGKGAVFIRVQNHGVNRAVGELKGSARGKAVFSQPLALAGNAGASFEFVVPGGLQQLRVVTETTGDGLEIDSRADLVEPKARMVTIANVLPREHAANASLEQVLTAIPEVQMGSRDKAQLVVEAAGTLPPSSPALWWLGIGPVSATPADIKAARDLKGPYLLEKRNPLLDGIELDGVYWGGIQPLKNDSTPLISAGQQRLLSVLNGTRTTAYLLNIDLSRSNLTESPDWPILLSNLVESRRNSLPGLQRWNYHLGENVAFRLFEGDPSPAAGALSVEFDGRRKLLARSEDVELAAPGQAGVYTLREGEQILDQFAVNFQDPETSNLRTLRRDQRPAKVLPTTPQVAIVSPHSWAILIGLILILLFVLGDWYSLRRAPAV